MNGTSSQAPTPQVIYVRQAPAATTAPVFASEAALSAAPADPAVAGQHYLAAAKVYNKASDALYKKYKIYGTLKRARASFKASAKVSRIFTDAIRTIDFPLEMMADVKALLRADAKSQALEIEGSGARSWADVASVGSALTKAYRAGSAAANLVRQDLGLPSVPTT